MGRPSTDMHVEAQIGINKVARDACRVWIRLAAHGRTSLVMTVTAWGVPCRRDCHRIGYGLTVVRYVCWPFLICRMTTALIGLRFSSNL